MPAHALPHIPSSNSLSGRGEDLSPELDDNVSNDAYILVFDYIDYRLKQRHLRWHDCPELPAVPNETMRAMRRLGSKFEERYRQDLAILSDRFPVTPETGVLDFEVMCATGIFKRDDGAAGEMKINWGRIVSLFAFGGILSARCYQSGRANLIANLAQWIAIFVESHLLQWVESQGGWDVGLVQFANRGLPQPQVPEKPPVWPVVAAGAAAAAVGVGAIALASVVVRS